MNEKIKRLREETNVGFMHAKKAYEKADGDYEKALLALQEEGWRIANNRTAKLTRHSTIGYYVHANQRVVAMVELCCETDLTASADFFNRFANEIAMHIAAKGPKYLSKDAVPNELLYETDLQKECLLEQKYVRDEEKTIKELIMEFIYTHKENTEIKRFVCYHAIREL
jgi:elongation factor Ts